MAHGSPTGSKRGDDQSGARFAQVQFSMTSDDLDAFRMARVLIELHPADALARAQRRARRLAVDDADGAARWCKIAEVIEQLERGRRVN